MRLPFILEDSHTTLIPGVLGDDQGGKGRDHFALYVIPFLFLFFQCTLTITALGVTGWPIARKFKIRLKI